MSTGQGFIGNNMFAYCGNNPVCRIDPTGHAYQGGGLWWLLEQFLDLIASAGYKLPQTKHNSRSNRSHDSNEETSTKNKLVNDQNGRTGALFKYGNYRASHNACEAIAIHNAKVLLEKDSTLSETIDDCTNAGSLMGDGTFGSNPHTIGDVLASSGISYTKVQRYQWGAPGVYIISFWNDGNILHGAHTVAFEYDGANYLTYNLYGDGSVRGDSPYSYAYSYICGYYLGE